MTKKKRIVSEPREVPVAGGKARAEMNQLTVNCLTGTDKHPEPHLLLIICYKYETVLSLTQNCFRPSYQDLLLCRYWTTD